MTCREVQYLLPDFLRGKLTDEETSLVTQHLHKCKNCQQELTALQQVYDRLDAMESDEPSEQYWQTFLPRFHQRIEASRKRRVPGWVPRFALPLTGIAVVIIVVLGVLLPRSGRVETNSIVTENDIQTLLQTMSAGELQQVTAEYSWLANGVSTLRGDADVLRVLIDTASISVIESGAELAQLTDREVDAILAYLDQKQFIR